MKKKNFFAQNKQFTFFLILAGVKIYQNSKKPDAANAIQIITEVVV